LGLSLIDGLLKNVKHAIAIREKQHGFTVGCPCRSWSTQ